MTADKVYYFLVKISRNERFKFENKSSDRYLVMTRKIPKKCLLGTVLSFWCLFISVVNKNDIEIAKHIQINYFFAQFMCDLK